MNYRNKRNLSAGFIYCLLMSLLSACGGGGDGGNPQTGTGSPLSLPRMINVGGANVDIASNTAQAASLTVQPAAFGDAGTDYSTDPVNEYNLNESNIGLEIVNNLLCYVDEFSATSMVNQGMFKESVPDNLCIPGDTNPVIIDFYINSYRKDNNSPQIIQLWVEYPSYDNPAKTARAVAEFVIHEGVSSDAPYGYFDFYDFEYSDVSATAIPEWQLNSKINIRILKNAENLPRLEMVFNSTDTAGGTQATSELDSIMQGSSTDFVNGKGLLKQAYSDTNLAFTIESGSAFDTNYLNQVKRTNGVVENMVCKSRKDTIADVWSYNLYDAGTGQRVGEQTSPLMFDYVHDAVNDRNNKDPNDSASHQGVLYQLSYYGPGSLYGFGFDPVLYVPEVNLEDGTLLENLDGSYVTKAMEIGYLPKPVSDTNCVSLDVSNIFDDPDLDVSALPAIQAPSTSLDNWPNI